jgi:hypothetical protein
MNTPEEPIVIKEARSYTSEELHLAAMIAAGLLAGFVPVKKITPAEMLEMFPRPQDQPT